jgi:biopolymer transport protein ExbD
MRVHQARKSDATYELNLAPFLDIIVSIIPLLLLSVAFLEIKMIETSLPQVVAEAINNNKDGEVPPVNISLKVSAANGYSLIVKDKGKSFEERIPPKEGKLDFDALTLKAAQVKKTYTDVFALDLLPDESVPYDDIVKTMDAVRRMPASAGTITVTDKKTGETANTDLMFVDVVFANIVE